MASFTAVGDSVTLNMTHKGDTASVALSGTYNMTIALQREVGAPGSGAWDTIKEWDTANATVAYDYATKADNERLRLFVKVDTSGTCTATLTDSTDLILSEVKDSIGNVIMRTYQDGVVFYNSSGEVLVDLRQDQRYVQLTNADTAISAANTGKAHLVPNVSADRTFTLPTPAAGLYYKFIAQVGAADGHDWIIDTGADANYFLGAVTHLDTDAGTGAAEAVAVPSDLNSNSTLQINIPQGGTVLEMVCDGTNWTVWGVVVSATAPAFGDQ